MRMTIGTLAVALLCGGLSVAAAQDAQPGAKGQPGKKGEKGEKGPRFDTQRFLKDHDKNNDGVLTKDELPARMQDGFAEMDADKDGHLTAQELRNHAEMMAGRRPQMVELVYWVIDVPETNPASTRELQQAYAMLRKMDANNDGTLDPQEIKAARDQRRKDRLDQTFEFLDKNNDRKLSKDEARGVWVDDFDRLDTNKDGSLDEKEIEAAYDLKPDAGQPGIGTQPRPGTVPPRP